MGEKAAALRLASIRRNSNEKTDAEDRFSASPPGS